jgi:hypothetical protein
LGAVIVWILLAMVGLYSIHVGAFIGKGLKYAKLIAAEGGDGPYPAGTWQTT